MFRNHWSNVIKTMYDNSYYHLTHNQLRRFENVCFLARPFYNLDISCLLESISFQVCRVVRCLQSITMQLVIRLGMKKEEEESIIKHSDSANNYLLCQLRCRVARDLWSITMQLIIRFGIRIPALQFFWRRVIQAK